jgi:hypothetical protein
LPATPRATSPRRPTASPDAPTPTRPADRIPAHPSPAPRRTTGVGAHPRNHRNTARQARNCMNPNNPRSKRRPIRPAQMRARGTAGAAALAAVLVCATHTAPAEAAPSSVSPGDRIATPRLVHHRLHLHRHRRAHLRSHRRPLRLHSTCARSKHRRYRDIRRQHRRPAPQRRRRLRPGRLRAPHSSADRHQRPSSRQETHTAAARPNRLPIRNHHRRAVRQHRRSLRRSPVPDHRYAAEPRWRLGSTVWAVGDDGRVQVLGIWLGGRTAADGHDYGRFAALSSAVSALGITSAD